MRRTIVILMTVTGLAMTLGLSAWAGDLRSTGAPSNAESVATVENSATRQIADSPPKVLERGVAAHTDASGMEEPAQTPRFRLQPWPLAAGRAPTSYQIPWQVVAAAGVDGTSGSYVLKATLGQPAAGEGSSASFGMGAGYWYGVGGTGPDTCAVVITGDASMDGVITAADIIYLVNYTFKGGAVPLPCEAAGDVNCDGVVTASDIIFSVNYTFKGGPEPCDVCTLIPATWSCP